MPESFHVRARTQELLASAGWQIHAPIPRTDIPAAKVSPADRGTSRGILLADIKPIADEEKLAS